MEDAAVIKIVQDLKYETLFNKMHTRFIYKIKT